MSHRKSKRTFVKESTSKSSSASTTRKHVICDCNLCQGASVDPRTRASHMKKVELTRGHASSDRPSEVGTSGTSQSHIHNDPMDMDEMEIGYSSGDEQEFNFLVTKPKKSKRKFNIDPLALID